MRKEYLDGAAALSAFIDEANRKLWVPLEVSFLNVKMFAQGMEASFFLQHSLEILFKMKVGALIHIHNICSSVMPEVFHTVVGL